MTDPPSRSLDAVATAAAAAAAEEPDLPVPQLPPPIDDDVAAVQASPNFPVRRGKRGTQQQVWDMKFNALLAYKAKYGDTHVPSKYDKDQPLSYWVEQQRRTFWNGKLWPERKARLDEIGFVWKVGKGRKRQSSIALDSLSNVAKPLPAVVAKPTIESLLRVAATRLARPSDEVMPYVFRLEQEWYFEPKQLEGIDLDTLARFIPHGLAKELLRVMSETEDSAEPASS